MRRILVGWVEAPSDTLGFKVKVSTEDLGVRGYVELDGADRVYVAVVDRLRRVGGRIEAECRYVGEAPRTPVPEGTPVFKASPGRIAEALGLKASEEDTLFLGLLKETDVKVNVEVARFGRVFIVGKTGSGKSYTAAVVVEELLEKGVPVIVVDVHGEYSSLKAPADRVDPRFTVQPKSYADRIVEIGEPRFNPNVDLGLDYLESMKPEDLVVLSQATILNLRGLALKEQRRIVAYILEKLFEAASRGAVPPFFCIIDEAHRFAGKSKSSSLEAVKLVVQEGRKFGFNCILVTQRPQLLDTTVRGLVGTWIIHRLTDPNDVRIALEGGGVPRSLAYEVRWLRRGEALVSGEAVDQPLLVEVRCRRTRHGGEALDPLRYVEHERLEKARERVARLRSKILRAEYRVAKPRLSLPEAFLPVRYPKPNQTIPVPPGLKQRFHGLEYFYLPYLHFKVDVKVTRRSPPVGYEKTYEGVKPVFKPRIPAYIAEVEAADVGGTELKLQPDKPGGFEKPTLELEDEKTLSKIRQEVLAEASANLTCRILYHRGVGRWRIGGKLEDFREECLKIAENMLEEKARILKSEIEEKVRELKRKASEYKSKARRAKSKLTVRRYMEALGKIEAEVRLLKSKLSSKLRSLESEYNAIVAKPVEQYIVKPRGDEMSIASLEIVWVPVGYLRVEVEGETGKRVEQIFWNAFNGRSYYGTCKVCGSPVEDVEDGWICFSCLHPLCPTHRVNCRVCGKTFCEEHVWVCSVCGGAFCFEEKPDKCGICGAFLCTKDVRTCSLCGIPVCPSCSVRRGILTRKTYCIHCSKHPT